MKGSEIMGYFTNPIVNYYVPSINKQIEDAKDNNCIFLRNNRINLIKCTI